MKGNEKKMKERIECWGEAKNESIDKIMKKWEIVEWFEQEGKRRREEKLKKPQSKEQEKEKATAPPSGEWVEQLKPPPYNEQKKPDYHGIYPVINTGQEGEAQEIELEITGGQVKGVIRQMSAEKGDIKNKYEGSYRPSSEEGSQREENEILRHKDEQKGGSEHPRGTTKEEGKENQQQMDKGGGYQLLDKLEIHAKRVLIAGGQGEHHRGKEEKGGAETVDERVKRSAEQQSQTSLATENEEEVSQGMGPEDEKSQPDNRSMKVRIDGEVQLTSLEQVNLWPGKEQDEAIKIVLKQSCMADETMQELKEHTSHLEMRVEELRGDLKEEQKRAEQRIRGLQYEKEETTAAICKGLEKRLQEQEEKIAKATERVKQGRRAKPTMRDKRDKAKWKLLQNRRRVITRSQAQSQQREVDKEETETSSDEEGEIDEPESRRAAATEPDEYTMPKMAAQYPLIVKGQQIYYVPWTFMDVTGLVKRLPSVCEGAQKWITKFEEQTMGQSLALGDLKVILCQTVGKAKIIEMFGLAGLGKEANDSRADGITFGPFRNRLWDQLREAYPTKADPGKVEKLKLDEEEGVAQFILKLQESWREEMGASWDETPASMTLFKLMLKRALPAEVQDQLETVVGLNTMPWATFEANVIHHTELHRKRKREAKKAEENLLVQLHKAQLGELTRNK
ncbi:golgin subfamily A member 6-like protein 25 [Tachysurus vachellii]|nr:golgin subfamily A member 6-like protein 25 [Tachysurus vachellii]